MTLEFTLNRGPAADVATDCIVVGAFTGGALTPAAQSLDREGRLAALAARGDVSGAAGRTQMLHDLPGVAAPRVLVVGLGERAKFGVPQYLKAVADAVRALRTGPVKKALLTLTELPVEGRDAAWAVRQAVIAADHAAYRYVATLGAKNKKREESGLSALAVQGDDEQALAQGKAIAAGVKFARELGNLPPNICNPAYVAGQAREFASRTEGVEVEVLEEAQMEQLGMGALLAVARGSANRPRLVVLEWNNGGDASPYALVGKQEKKDDRATQEFEFRPFGHGSHDVKAVVEAGIAAGASWFVIEQDLPYSASPLDDAKMSLDTLIQLGVK